MRKMAVCVIVAFLMMFCGCAKDFTEIDTQNANELNSAIEAVNSETRLSGKYVIEFSFGDNVTFYYSAGDISWDREKEKISNIFNHTYLGESSKASNYFENGKMISVESGEAMTLECNADEIFTKFPYCAVDKYSDSCGKITVSENTTGKSYSFVRNDTAMLCDKIVGGDIYDLVAVLKKPQKEKTEYGETKCIFTVSNGKIASCRYEFDMKLFDTPAVVDGYTPPEEEYTLKLHITAKVVYEDFGEDVKIDEYSDEK